MVSVTKDSKLLTSIKVFEEVFRFAYVTEDDLDAGTYQYYRPTERQKERYAPFNTLWCYNADADSTIRIYLDGDTSNFYDVPPSSSIFINPEDGIFFSFFDYKNLSSSSTISAGKIRYRVGKGRPKATLQTLN